MTSFNEADVGKFNRRKKSNAEGEGKRNNMTAANSNSTANVQANATSNYTDSVGYLD